MISSLLHFLFTKVIFLFVCVCECVCVYELDVSAITLYSYSFTFGDLKPQAIAAVRNPWVYKYFLAHRRKLFIMNLI